MRVLSLVMATVVGANKLNFLTKDKAPAGEVYLSDTKILGAGASNPSMDCQRLTAGQVASKTEPRFKVVGVNLKVKVFLKNDCEEYKSVEVGSCDSSKPASTEHEVGPGMEGAPVGMEHFQSYKIMYCSA